MRRRGDVFVLLPCEEPHSAVLMLFLHRLYLFCVCDTPLMCVSTTAACTKYHRVNTTKSSAVYFTGLDKPLSVNSSSPGHGSSLQGVLRSSSSI